jgi:hypothetical protein
MAILFSIVFGLLFGMMVSGSLGFIKPKWIHKENRKEVSIFVGSSFIFIIIVTLFVPEDIEVNSTANLLAFLFGLWIPFWDLKKWEQEQGEKEETEVPSAKTLQAMEEADNQIGETISHEEFIKESKKKEVASTKFKLQKYNTKKNDILHIKDITDYSDLRKDVKSLEDYNFEARGMIELEVNHENELFYAVNRSFLSSGNYGLDYDQEEILCSKASFDFHPNVFSELYSLYIDEEYDELSDIEYDFSSFEFIDSIKMNREEQHNSLMSHKKDELIALINKADNTIEAKGTKAILCDLILDNNLDVDNNKFYYKLKKEKFESFLNKISKELMFTVDLLIWEWHVYGQLEVYQQLHSDYEPLRELVEEEIERLKIEVSLLED